MYSRLHKQEIAVSNFLLRGTPKNKNQIDMEATIGLFY